MSSGQPDGDRSPVRILPRVEQEHLDRVSLERPVGGGLLIGVQSKDCPGEPLPQGVLGSKAGARFLAGGESAILAGFSGHLGWSDVSAPADCICGPAEVTLSGVGLHATRQPVHRDGCPNGRGCAVGHIYPIPLSGGHVSDQWEGNHRSSVQIGWYHPPRPNSDRRGELDIVLSDNGAPSRGVPPDRRIQVGKLYTYDE